MPSYYRLVVIIGGEIGASTDFMSRVACLYDRRMVCHLISLSHRSRKQKISPSLFLECFILNDTLGGKKRFSKSFFNHDWMVAMKGAVPKAFPLSLWLPGEEVGK